MQKKISDAGILLLILGCVISCKPEANDLESTKFLIDSIQSQSIPDSRIELFAVKATYSGDAILLKGKTTNPEAVNKLEAQLKLQQVEYIDSIIRLPDPALKGRDWGLVTLSVANIRTTPANSAELATQALLGTPVRILQEENGWLLIQTPDQYIAWTQSSSIAPLTREGLEEWKSSERLIYLADNGLITSSPENGSLPVCDIVMGGIISADPNVKVMNSFIAVQLPDGRKGFVPQSDCRDFKEWAGQVSPDSSRLLKTAVNLTGRPYLWGGTSTKGFDCSGFTRTIYMTGGLILSRDASQQVLQGSAVPGEAIWKGLKSGDLLFFGRTASAELSEKVTHVGMYTGDSGFIHCSVSSGQVGVNSLDSTRNEYKPYYRTNLLHVKRMIGSGTQPPSFKSHPWYN